VNVFVQKFGREQYSDKVGETTKKGAIPAVFWQKRSREKAYTVQHNQLVAE